VSVRSRGQQEFGTRTELKNINSFRFVERAINFEVERQIDVLEGGGKVVQETRLFDPDKNETRPMRSKEEANDYRYFPDPDLLPVELDTAFIETVRGTLPELPDAKQQRFMTDYDLSAYDAGALTASRELADYFEEAAHVGGDGKLAANWVTGELAGLLNREGLEITASPVSAASLGGLLLRIRDNTLSGKLAKQVFEDMCSGAGEADAIIEQKGLKQITDTGAIEKIIQDVLDASPKQIEQYRAGQEKLFGYFVGQVMKATQGKANPAQVNELLKKRLAGD
jgi:aspartyl-tRNA(Asn)/glutamyl-tRNA(Gln) amidotransferase subunit B